MQAFISGLAEGPGLTAPRDGALLPRRLHRFGRLRHRHYLHGQRLGGRVHRRRGLLRLFRHVRRDAGLVLSQTLPGAPGLRLVAVGPLAGGDELFPALRAPAGVDVEGVVHPIHPLSAAAWVPAGEAFRTARKCSVFGTSSPRSRISTSVVRPSHSRPWPCTARARPASIM